MKKIKTIAGKILYHSVARHLPVSYSRIKVGQKRIRALCGRLILDKCGNNVNIEKGAVFSSKVEIGDNSGIGINANISGPCVIGDNVMMGPDCIIYTRNHAFDRADIPMCKQGNTDEKAVRIGNDVWIGSRVIILPGVKIGDHSVIGAGSVVTKDVPEWAIAAGNPAVVKKYRSRE